MLIWYGDSFPSMHDEIDFDTADDYITKKFGWAKVKERLNLAVKNPDKIFISKERNSIIPWIGACIYIRPCF